MLDPLFTSIRIPCFVRDDPLFGCCENSKLWIFMFLFCRYNQIVDLGPATWRNLFSCVSVLKVFGFEPVFQFYFFLRFAQQQSDYISKESLGRPKTLYWLVEKFPLLGNKVENFLFV